MRAAILQFSAALGLALTASTIAQADTASPSPFGGAWISTLQPDHPLVGKIWSRKTEKFLSKDALFEVIGSPRFLLLGEKHTNPDHHRIQAALIEARASRGGNPAVVFEMIDRDQSETLKRYLAKSDASAEGLGAALNWKKRGWPSWPIYQPIAEASFRHNLTILPGSLTRQTIRAVAKQGVSVLGADRVKLWQLSKPLAGPLAEALGKVLDDSHCGMMPKSMLPIMLKVQRARDASLADAMIAAGSAAILIAGNGHTRSDWGVPAHLKSRLPGSETISVAMVEVVEGSTNPKDYLNWNGPQDYLVFTPVYENRDYCAELKARMKSKKH